jgi:hypothetical protein
LRARYYDPGMGRFLTKYTWDGDINNPLTYNLWNYVGASPINRRDPSGHVPCDTLSSEGTGYCDPGVEIDEDLLLHKYGITLKGRDRNWKEADLWSLSEIREIKAAAEAISSAFSRYSPYAIQMSGDQIFRRVYGNLVFLRDDTVDAGYCWGASTGVTC